MLDTCGMWYFVRKRRKCLDYCFAAAKFKSYTAIMTDQWTRCRNVVAITSLTNDTIIECYEMHEVRYSMYDNIHVTLLMLYLVTFMNNPNLVNFFLGVKTPLLVSLLGGQYEDFMSIAFSWIYLSHTCGITKYFLVIYTCIDEHSISTWMPIYNFIMLLLSFVSASLSI